MVHRMFARKMIQDLEESNLYDDRERTVVDKVITDLGLKYSLASKHTSFIGVDDKVNQEAGGMVTRQVRDDDDCFMMMTILPGSQPSARRIWRRQVWNDGARGRCSGQCEDWFQHE